MQKQETHSAAWKIQVWLGFACAIGSTGIGIAYLPIAIWVKAFLGMGLLFTVNSCFALAKTLRDDHEATRLISRLDDAKAEKILREFEVAEAR